MSEDQLDKFRISRRAIIGAATAAPLACMAGEATTTPTADSLIGLCTHWLTVDIAIDRLARRWAQLEMEAVAKHDYFNLSSRARDRLPMMAEMDAIDVTLEKLWEEQEPVFRVLKKMTPANVHEMASMMVVAARIEGRDEGPAGSLSRKAMAFISEAKCPGCGSPYVPPSLPRS